MSQQFALILAVCLFFAGAGGALARRSILVTTLSLLFAQTSGIFLLVHAALEREDPGGLSRAIILILLSVALFMIQGAVAIAIYRHRATVNIDELRELRG